jgi:hypothetical protein
MDDFLKAMAILFFIIAGLSIIVGFISLIIFIFIVIFGGAQT